jgi:hypothetical protein
MIVTPTLCEKFPLHEKRFPVDEVTPVTSTLIWLLCTNEPVESRAETVPSPRSPFLPCPTMVSCQGLGLWEDQKLTIRYHSSYPRFDWLYHRGSNLRRSSTRQQADLPPYQRLAFLVTTYEVCYRRKAYSKGSRRCLQPACKLAESHRSDSELI